LSEDYDMVLMLGYQIISIDYYNYYANYRIAYSLSEDGKLDMSETILNKMLTIYPSDVLFLTELGLLQLKQDKPALAKITLLNVIILDPENVRAKRSLLNINE
jgi:tetratricopeptide (TPR) repeat protein